MKLPLSKAIIEKLSIADAQTVSQFLKSLKSVVDKFEQDKELELENSQHFPFYIIENGDMIQVSGTLHISFVIQQTVREGGWCGQNILFDNKNAHNTKSKYILKTKNTTH